MDQTKNIYIHIKLYDKNRLYREIRDISNGIIWQQKEGALKKGMVSGHFAVRKNISVKMFHFHYIPAMKPGFA